MTPDFLILADAADVTDQIRDRLISIEITDQVGVESDQLTLSLDDRDGGIAIPRRGTVLAASLGYRQTGLVDMGRFTVDQVEMAAPSSTMSIRARSADMRATLKEQRTQAWEGETLGGVVGAIAARHGLAARLDPALASSAIPYLAQTEESDLNLLTRLGFRYDAVIKPAGGTLVCTPRGQGRAADGRPLPTLTLTLTDLLRWNVTLSDHSAYGAVESAAYNPREATRQERRAGLGDGPRRRHRHLLPTEGEAAAEARAAKRALDRRQARLTATLPGRPELLAETQIRVTGVRTGVDGRWSITSARHRYGSQGYVTEIEAEPPA